MRFYMLFIPFTLLMVAAACRSSTSATPDDAKRFIDEVNHPAVQANIDVSHRYWKCRLM